MTGPAADPFAFSNFREYLRAERAARKVAGRPFSFQIIADLAGLSSRGHAQQVVERVRPLSLEAARRVAAACELEGDAFDYFLELVRFANSKTEPARQGSLARLAGLRAYRHAERLKASHDAYHSHWFIPAVRELALRDDFRADARWIAEILVPSISQEEAAHALAVLLELRMLVSHPSGRLVQATTIVTTGPEATGAHVADYHRAMLARASESIELVPSDERDISSLTMCLGPEGLRLLKSRLQGFRKEVLADADAETQHVQVVQLEMALFPLSRADSPLPRKIASPRPPPRGGVRSTKGAGPAKSRPTVANARAPGNDGTPSDEEPRQRSASRIKRSA